MEGRRVPGRDAKQQGESVVCVDEQAEGECGNEEDACLAIATPQMHSKNDGNHCRQQNDEREVGEQPVAAGQVWDKPLICKEAVSVEHPSDPKKGAELRAYFQIHKSEVHRNQQEWSGDREDGVHEPPTDRDVVEEADELDGKLGELDHSQAKDPQVLALPTLGEKRARATKPRATVVMESKRLANFRR